MTIPCYIAMTAGEFSVAEQLPHHTAWMACHFSSSDDGLSNLPMNMPAGSMIIVDDQIPVCDHDPALVVRQLQELAEKFQPAYFLLDMQRSDTPLTRQMVQAVADAFGQQVGVSELYAHGLNCPVFVGACPLRVALAEHVEKWAGREIWLEAALEAETVTIDHHTSRSVSVPLHDMAAPNFYDERLYCRYHTQLQPGKAIFTVQRDKNELNSLMESAEKLGVKLAVGLYQQLGDAISQFGGCQPPNTLSFGA